jgi:HEAT repeat protein
MLLWKKLQLTMSGPEARLDAIRKLAHSNDPDAVDILIDALKDRDGQVPIMAAAALGHIGNARAVPGLVALLKGSEEYLRGPASEALGQLGQPAVGPVVSLLRDSDPKIRDLAAETLGKIGITAVAPLATLLRSPDQRLRVAAAAALGQINQARSVDLLLGALKDPDSGVVDQTVRSLVHIGRTVVPGLLKLLNDPSNDIRQRALGVLQKLGAEPMTLDYIRPVAYGKWKDADVGSPALDALVGALQDPERGKRSTAVLTLANLGNAQAVPGLTTALADSDREIRETATRALVKIKGGAVEHLLATLKSGPKELRARAAVVLGYIGDSRAVEALMGALADREPAVRGAAAEALASYKDSRSVDPLLALLRDPDAQVRFSAVGALWRVGDTRANEPLAAALRDKDPSTRKRAAQALGDMGDDHAIGPLLRCFQDDPAARLEAALAVAKIHPARAVRLLLTVAAEDPLEAEEAVAILADVLEAAAVKLAPEDLQALVGLPQRLAARPDGGKRPGAAKAIDASAVVKRATDELARRGHGPHSSGAAAPGTERRALPPRPLKR